MKKFKIKKIIWGLMASFLLLSPVFSVKAQVSCGAGAGTCIENTNCSLMFNSGLNNGECISSFPSIPNIVCCASGNLTGTPPTPNPSPNPSSTAAAYQEGSTGGFLLLRGHLVPCGRHSDDPGTTTDETEDCTLCHFALLLKNIFDLMLSLLIVTAILFITVGGVVYIVSMGNPRLTGVAKNIITKTLFGFGIMMVGWLLVYTLLVFLSTGNMVGRGTSSWFEFTCDSESRFNTPTN